MNRLRKMEDDVNLVKEVVQQAQALSELTVDKINETPITEIAPQLQLTKEQLAAKEGVPYIKPKRRLPAMGKLPESLRAEHDRDWEYVKGIYENYVFSGESLTFWLCKYEGDHDCLWEIPANKPCYVPRMIAKHLENAQNYHEFAQVPSIENLPRFQLNDTQIMSHFHPTATKSRGKFRPVEAFA